MPNADTPQGLIPFRHLAGGLIRETTQKIVAAYASDIFRGDLVKLAATGYLQVAVAGDVDLIGAFAGCRYRNAQGEQVFSAYWPANQATLSSEDAVAYVWEDPNITFEVQADTTTAAALTHVGNNADMIATHAGSTQHGQSGQEIALAAAAAGTAQLRVLGLVDKPDNAFGVNAKLEVRINEHKHLSATGV